MIESRQREKLDIPETLLRKLEGMYNETQLEALKDCLKASGITLIQGPPGTGKTTTIVGVLSVILNSSVRPLTKKERTALEATEDKIDTASAPFVLESDESDSDGIAGVRSSKRSCDLQNLAKLRRCQPWIYDSKYEPWYDTIEMTAESVEVPLERVTVGASRCATSHPKQFMALGNMVDEAQPRRVLVCAPSNAAIDEILRRLTRAPQDGGGVFDGEGKRYTPNVVRVGPNVHPDLLEYSLEHKASSRLSKSMAKQQTELAHRDRFESMKAQILKEAYIVCATLSSCGSRDMTSFSGVFDTVVIDEASQGVELATLIPLRLGCRRLILVGDPRQLPATVFSKVAIDQNYSQSLFQRLQRAAHKVNMLNTQYRMHPDIAKFPSKLFYEGRLENAPNILELAKPPFPYYSLPVLRPVVFFSVESQEAKESTSKVNRMEVEVVCEILTFLNDLFADLNHPAYKDGKWKDAVAVISPYAKQVELLQKSIMEVLHVDRSQPCPIDVNTVDGFQGREKDFVIFSAVRAHALTKEELLGDDSRRKTNVGFLGDERRMNVALTRARLNLFVVGNGRHLAGNPNWGQFWRSAATNEFQFHVNFETIPTGDYINDWMRLYIKRRPEARDLLSLHCARYLERLENPVYKRMAKTQDQNERMNGDSDPADKTSCSADDIIDDTLEETLYQSLDDPLVMP